MIAVATARPFLPLAGNLLGFVFAMSGWLCGQDLNKELRNNPQGLALLTFSMGQIRLHRFDGPDITFCVSDRSLTPYVSQEGRAILWRARDALYVQPVGGSLRQHQSVDPMVRWLVSVPHHPEALAYAVPSATPLTDKIIFEATPETAKLLGWPAPHFEREQRSTRTTPSWSPDGKQLALPFFDTSPTAGKSYLVVLLWNVVSGEGKKVASGTTPSWSPDGQTIGYLRSHGPENPLAGEAWLYHVATGRDEKLFEFDNLDASLLRWSPDGQYFLYGRTVHDTPIEANTADVIWIYRLHDGATTEMFQVPRESLVNRGPDWISNWQDLQRTPGPLLKSCEK